MTDQNKTAILVVLDRSGSMRGISDDVVGGFNQMVEDQKKEPGEATLSLVQFDTEYEVNYLNTPLGQVPPLLHTPRGGTAMLDAIGRGIVELGESLRAQPEAERPGRVLVVIMTDGMENSSQEWTVTAVKALIEKQETTYGWKFVFIGANISAAAEASKLGIQGATQFDATNEGTRQAYQGMSRGISGYRSGGGYEK